MADEKLRSYRRHSEKPWELEPELSEHRSAMTTEALHSKAEIAEEFAVRDRKIAALEARAEKAEREQEDTVPAHIHEDLRQVMLGERRRAEKAELERDEARDQRDLAQCDVVLSNAEIAYARDLQYSARIRELEKSLLEAEVERNVALSRVRELEADAEELEAYAEEPAAFRWLVKWLHCDPLRGIGELVGSTALCATELRDGTTCIVGVGATPVALATALDPNWRKACENRED